MTVTSVNRHRVFQSGAATALAIVIAANLSAAPAEEIVSTSVSCPSTKAFTDPLSGPHWNGWGVDLSQRRFQPADMAQLAAEDVPKLKLAWAFGFDSVNRAYAQPTIVGARLFIGSANGKVYSLDAKTGCIIWTFEASAPVRTAISIGIDARGWSAYFGDQRANAYALDALSGKLLESANRRASCGNYYGGSRARRPGALCAYHLLRRSDWC
jgi:polyvinyl alcohol dehydrogenase (cytochrome)